MEGRAADHAGAELPAPSTPYSAPTVFAPAAGRVAAPAAQTIEAPTVEGYVPMSPAAKVEAGAPLGEL
eukprot:2168528-Alexandrium_andersonii.AAC.1